MVNSTREAIGYYMNNNGQIDVGLFKDGFLMDYGKRIEKNGDSYSGNFNNGLLIGKGIVHIKEKTYWMLGEFDDQGYINQIQSGRSNLPVKFSEFEDFRDQIKNFDTTYEDVYVNADVIRFRRKYMEKMHHIFNQYTFCCPTTSASDLSFCSMIRESLVFEQHLKSLPQKFPLSLDFNIYTNDIDANPSNNIILVHGDQPQTNQNTNENFINLKHRNQDSDDFRPSDSEMSLNKDEKITSTEKKINLSIS